jgi:hypothetical protein
MGHTRFWAKEADFTSFRPQGHAAAPKKQATAGRAKEEPLQQKARQKPGFSIFGDLIILNIGNRISAVNTAFVKTVSI